MTDTFWFFLGFLEGSLRWQLPKVYVITSLDKTRYSSKDNVHKFHVQKMPRYLLPSPDNISVMPLFAENFIQGSAVLA